MTVSFDATGAPASIGLEYAHGYQNKGPVVPRHGNCVEKPNPGDRNQCIFLKFYMMKKRFIPVFPDKLVANAEPRDPFDSRGPDAGPAVPSSMLEDVDVEMESRARSVVISHYSHCRSATQLLNQL